MGQRTGPETASRGRLRLVGPPHVGRTMALADTFPDDALPQLSDEWMAEVRRRSAEWHGVIASGGAAAATGRATRSRGHPRSLARARKTAAPDNPDSSQWL